MHTLLLLLTPGQHLPGIVWFSAGALCIQLKNKGTWQAEGLLVFTGKYSASYRWAVGSSKGGWSLSQQLLVSGQHPPAVQHPPGTQEWARQYAMDPDSSALALPAGAAAASTAPLRRKKWDWWWVLPLCPHFFPHPQLGLRPSLLRRASPCSSFPYRFA